MSTRIVAGAVPADGTEPPAWRSAWWPWAVIAAVLAMVLVFGALAPREPSTTTEQVADIAGAIRCPTCSGESVAVSDADISKQIRLDIAQRLQQGQTPDQIRAFYASRYGEAILLTPESSGVVGLVWVLPVAALVAAVCGLVLVFRRWNTTSSVHATTDDVAIVETALAQSATASRPTAPDRTGGSGSGADAGAEGVDERHG